MSTLGIILIALWAFCFGFAIAAVLSAGSDADEWADGYRQGRGWK